MSAIFTEVCGDAVGPAQNRQSGSDDGVGFGSTPRLTNGGDVINIHT